MVSFSASKILKMYPVVNRSAPFSISMMMISSDGRSNASPELGTIGPSAPIDLAFLKWGTPNHPSHGWSDDHFSIETHAFADLGEFLGYLHFRKPPFGGFPVHLRHSWANMSLWSLHEAWTFLHSVTESQLHTVGRCQTRDPWENQVIGLDMPWWYGALLPFKSTVQDPKQDRAQPPQETERRLRLWLGSCWWQLLWERVKIDSNQQEWGGANSELWWVQAQA